MNSFPLLGWSPSPPQKVRCKISTAGDELQIVWPMARGAGLLLLVWLIGWTAGCLVLIALLVNNFHWLLALFSVPFLAAWVFVAGLTVYLLFGSHRLALSADHLHYQWQALVLLYRRQIPIEQVERARYDPSDISSSKSAPTRRGSIRIATLDNSIAFAQGISEDEGRWIAQLVNQCLDRLTPGRRGERRESHEAPLHEHNAIGSPLSADDFSLETVSPSSSPIPRPVDSRWRLGQERRATTFSQRGRWLPFLIGSTTLLNLFWNGIVAILVVALMQKLQWSLAILLVPLAAIGLLIFVIWIFSLLAPCQTRSHQFRLGSMVYRSAFMGIGKAEEHHFGELERIAIAREGGDVEESTDLEELEAMTSRFTLCLIDDQQGTVAKVTGLTWSEARWMADTLWREQPDMFSRRSRRTG